MILVDTKPSTVTFFANWAERKANRLVMALILTIVIHGGLFFTIRATYQPLPPNSIAENGSVEISLDMALPAPAAQEPGTNAVDEVPATANTAPTEIPTTNTLPLDKLPVDNLPVESRSETAIPTTKLKPTTNISNEKKVKLPPPTPKVTKTTTLKKPTETATPTNKNNGNGQATTNTPATNGQSIKPQPLSTKVNAWPVYPALAIQRGQEGKVMLLVDVDERGIAVKVIIQQSSGHRLLDKAALEAVQKWQFLPAKMADKAVAGQVLVPIQFQLKDR